jgi:hypothetical protein
MRGDITSDFSTLTWCLYRRAFDVRFRMVRRVVSEMRMKGRDVVETPRHDNRKPQWRDIIKESLNVNQLHMQRSLSRLPAGKTQ